MIPTLILAVFIWYHPATRAECAAEIEREQILLLKLGGSGDPPISMGTIAGGRDGGYFMNPCGYTNGVIFAPLYGVFSQHTCEVGPPADDHLWPSEAELSRLIQLCESGKLRVIKTL